MAPAAPAGRRRDLHRFVLGLVVLAGLLLRLPGYFDSLNGDELATYFIVTGHGPGLIVDIVQGDQEVTPPLYLLLAGWTQGLGDSGDSLRLVPFLCGLLAMPLTWLLGVRTLDRRAATVGTAVMAVSPFLIFYSTEARAYGLAMVLALGSTLALLQAVRGTSRAWWALYAVLSCAAMYTHYTVAFVLAAQAAWALACHRHAWRWLLGANAAAALAWLPWLSSYQADQDSPGAGLIGALQPFGWGAMKTDLLHWAVSHPITTLSVREVPGDVGLGLIAAGLAAGMLVAGLERGRPWSRTPDAGLALVAALALSTPVLAALYSAVSVSVFLPRNLIASSPGLVLALGWLVTRPRARPARIGASALLVAGLAIGAVRMQSPDGRRPDYKGVARFIADRGGLDAVTVDLAGFSPGALTQLDAAAAPGQAMPTRPTILRLARPTLADQVRADLPGGAGQFAALPVASPEAVALRAARLARGRDIYLVDPVILQSTVLAAVVDRFRAALPAGYRTVGRRRFAGFFGTASVDVLILGRETR